MLNKKTYPCQLTVAGQYTGIRNKAPGYIYDRIWPIINGNKPVIKQLNQAIFNESMNRLKSFQKENKDNHPDSTSVVSTFEYSNFNYVIHADNRLASILSLQYWYSGGAHGMTSFNGESYILKGNKPVRLDLKTIFLPKTDYMEKLVSIVKEDIGKQRVGVTDAQKIPDISGKDLQTFTISTGGITFYFDPYAVGSYAEGYYSSYLSWDKLSEIINPKGPVGYLLPKK
jgi:hypothetical protein